MRQLEVLERLPYLAGELAGLTGRGLDVASPYRCEGVDTVVVVLGSVLGTLKDTVDELRDEGVPVGVLGVTAFRPFPSPAVAAALAGARRMVVLERAFATGVGGIVTADVRAALPGAACCTVVAGLGGRPVTSASLRDVLREAVAGRLEPLTFLDLHREVVDRELTRAAATRRSVPTAENVLHGLRGGAR